MTGNQTLPPPQGPEYTRCGPCGHIEPEHRPDAGPCLVCGCAAYRPAAAPSDEDFLVAVEEALESVLLPEPGVSTLERARDAVTGALAPLVAVLRRGAGEAQQPETQADTRAAIVAELLPAWEAMYEPGNVSDYLIGYANSEPAAKGAAEAWMRSQAEVTGRLEWVPQRPLDGYDAETELVERHDDGIDTGPGITVRRRVEPAAVSRPDGEA